MNIEKFIYLNETSLSPELCKDIIILYENERFGKYPGVTGSGYNPEIKNALDFIIPNNDSWCRVRNFLIGELHRNLKLYLEYLKTNFNIIIKEELFQETFLMHKYTKNQGKYIYHNDFNIEWKTKSHRIITYLWYLNSIDEGGETEILGNIKIKPKDGKLLIFPATWTYAHSGKIPISDNKYIITGWLYVDF
jgi:hypothetical protein